MVGWSNGPPTWWLGKSMRQWAMRGSRFWPILGNLRRVALVMGRRRLAIWGHARWSHKDWGRCLRSRRRTILRRKARLSWLRRNWRGWKGRETICVCTRLMSIARENHTPLDSQESTNHLIELSEHLCPTRICRTCLLLVLMKTNMIN